MRLSLALKIGLLIAAVCLCVQGQNPASDAAKIETKGLSPRAAPADYQAQVKAGTMTIAAEFKGHAVPTLQGPLTSEDYIVVEIGLFGAPDARTKLSSEDFSLRINGKKMPLPAQPFGLVFESLKDPEWEPPAQSSSKPKTSFGGSGKGAESDGPPAPVKIPVPVKRAMAQRVQKAALPEGDRALPQAGLIFFQYRGKTQKINSLELIYAGPAGKATLALQP
jgi:hypothetical protein